MRTKTSPGIVERHSRSCASRTGGTCNCQPSYEAWSWDNRSGKKVSKRFSGKGAKSAAKLWRADAVGAVRRGTLQPASKLTLREKAEAWLADAEGGVPVARGETTYSPSTLRGYRRDLERYVLPLLGARKLGDIRRRDLVAVKDRLWKENPTWSGQKVRNLFTPVQAIYRHALERDEVEIDPTAGLGLPKAAGRRRWSGTPAYAAALLDALPDSERALWATALYAGLRRGELRALRYRNIGAAITVEHGWDDFAGEREPKSAAARRSVPLPPTLRVLLEDIGDADELVFPQPKARSKPFTPGYVQDRADEAWQAAGLERVTLHECRHGYESFLDAAGVGYQRQQRYLGHALTDVTARYAHAIEGQLAEDAERLEAYLTGAAAGKVVPIQTGVHTGVQKASTA